MTTCIVIYSNGAFGDPIPFGDGELCVLLGAAQRSSPNVYDGTGAATFDLPPAGSTAQAWYRDATTNGFNLSNSIVISGVQ